MDGNRKKSSNGEKTSLKRQVGEKPLPDQEDHSTSIISVEQLQHLVRLLDHSDVSELELRRAAEGIHLVLRKVKAPESNTVSDGSTLSTQYIVPPAETQSVASSVAAPAETKHKVLAHIVGTFHTWVKPRGGALVAVGDRVKAGQLVGTIETLSVLNEIESPVAGRVVEILVQEGQPVEYGQWLMTIDSAVDG